MFFNFRSWVRNMVARLTGKRRGTTVGVRRKYVRRRCGWRLDLEILESRVTPASGLVSFAPGSILVDMGQSTQTVGNALKPYGLVYA
jgi:hypothetical protein